MKMLTLLVLIRRLIRRIKSPKMIREEILEIDEEGNVHEVGSRHVKLGRIRDSDGTY